MKTPNKIRQEMEKLETSTKGSFLTIDRDLAIITYLRQYFDLEEKFENLSYLSEYPNKKDQNNKEFPPCIHLNEAVEKTVFDSKGNKSLIFIHPRPGRTLGVLSDTFLDLLLLKETPFQYKEYIQRKRKSKYYLTQGWKPNTQTSYCEHIHLQNTNNNQDLLVNKLIQPIAYYKTQDGKYVHHNLNYFIPTVFLKHYISDAYKPMDGQRRIEKELLLEWGYIESEEDRITISEKTIHLLEEVQNLFFIEWWRSYFVHTNEINKDEIQHFMQTYQKCPKVIILYAFLESIVYKYKMYKEIQISEICNLFDIRQPYFTSVIQEWIIGDYFGSECIQNDKFIFPPSNIERFWANSKVMQYRYNNSLSFFSRNEEIKKISHFISSKNRILLIKGEAGIGKTRLLVEYAKKNPNKWNFYWIIKNKKILWDLIEKEAKNKNLVLIVDPIESFENINTILENYFQIEAINERIKIIFVSSNEMTADFFISQHFWSRNQEIISVISLKPLNFNNLSIKNDAVRVLCQKGISIESTTNLLNFSQGYPDIIEHELFEYQKYINRSEDYPVTISTFEQRMTSIWKLKLKKNEKIILKILSLTGDFTVKSPPINIEDIGQPSFENGITELIHMNLITNHHERIKIKRTAIRNWIIETQWTKTKENLKELNNLLDFWLENNISCFVKSINVLNSKLPFLDFKKILIKIEKWGKSNQLSTIQDQIIAAYYLLPYIAIKYVNNKIHMHNEPSTAKYGKNLDLISDIPNSILDLIKRLKNQWKNHINLQNLDVLLDYYHYLEQLLIIVQDYEGLIKLLNNLLNIIQNLPPNQIKKYSHVLNLLYPKILSFKSLNNPKNYDSDLEQYLSYPHISKQAKAFGLWLWCEKELENKGFNFSKIYPKLIKTSDHLAESNAKRDYIEFWSKIIPLIQINYRSKTNFIKLESDEKLKTIKVKLELAKKWAKSLDLTRQYISFILNWIIFDMDSDPKANIIELEKLIKYTLDKKEFYIAGDIYHQIGMEYEKEKDLENSAKNYELSIKYTKKSGILARLGNTYYHLGGIYWKMNKLDKAIEMHKNAYNDYKNKKNHSDTISSLNALFDLYLVRKEMENVFETAEKLQFVINKSDKSEYYNTALQRITESCILQKNFQSANKYLQKIKNEKLEYDSDHSIHLILLEALICHGIGDIANFERDISKYIEKIPDINFNNNSYEFFWIFLVLDVLYENNYEYPQNFAESLKNNLYLGNSYLSSYENFLHLISHNFNIKINDNSTIPEWISKFLKLFKRPNQLEIPESNLIEYKIIGAKNPSKVALKGILDRISVLCEESPKEKSFSEIFIELFNLVPYFDEEYIFSIHEIDQLTGGLMKTAPLYWKIESQVNQNKKRSNSPNLISQMLFDLSDFTIKYNYLHLTKKILGFLQNNEKYLSPYEKVHILHNWEVINEREGKKDDALTNALKSRELLKNSPDSYQIFRNELIILNLRLEKELNKELEFEIIQFTQKYQNRETLEYFYAFSLLCFLKIKKHQFTKAEEITSNITSTCPDSDFILWHLTEYLDRIIWKEKQETMKINPEFIITFLTKLDQHKILSKIELIAGYDNAIIGVIRNLFNLFKDPNNYGVYIQAFFHVIKILKDHNYEDIEKHIEFFLRNLSSQIGQLLEEKDFSSIIKTLTLVLQNSKEFNLIEFQFYSLNQLILISFLSKKNSEFTLYLEDFVKLFLEKKKEILEFRYNFETSEIILKESIDQYGLEEITLESEEIVELIIIRYYNLLQYLAYKKIAADNPEIASFDTLIWNISINTLKFKIIRKGNQEILISIWNPLLYQFFSLLQKYYLTSEYNDDFLVYNDTITSLQSINGLLFWEKDLIQLFQIFLSSNGESIKKKEERFRILKKKILNNIPEFLKENMRNLFLVVENAIGKGENPKQIGTYIKAAFIDFEIEICKKEEKISALISNLIEIVKIFFNIRDYSNCIEKLDQANIIFRQYGYNSELLILRIYRGMIAFEKGDLTLAKTEFESLQNNLSELEFRDFILIFIYLIQIHLMQKKEISSVIYNLNSSLVSKIKGFNEEERQLAFYQFISTIYSLNSAMLIESMIKYMEVNQNMLINAFTIQKNQIIHTIDELQLNYFIFAGKYEKFFANYLKLIQENSDFGFEYLTSVMFENILGNLDSNNRVDFNHFGEKKVENWFEKPPIVKIFSEFFKSHWEKKELGSIELVSIKNPLYLFNYCLKIFLDKYST